MMKLVIILLAALIPHFNCFAQFSSSCLTNQIDISTGSNQLNTPATLYPLSTASAVTLDKFWQITTIPSNTTGLTAPKCAELFRDSIANAGWLSTSACSYIGIVSHPIPSNSAQLSPISNFFWNCPPSHTNFVVDGIPGTTPVTFARSFYIQSSIPVPVSINFNFFRGDDIARIRIDTTVVYNPTTSTTLSAPGLVTQTVTLVSGLHHVYVDLWDISGIATGISLDASLSCTTNALVKSACFGESDATCQVITPIFESVDPLVESQSFELFPNPSNGNFNINLSSGSTSTMYWLECFDLTGRSIYKTNLKAGEMNTVQIPSSIQSNSLIYYRVCSSEQSTSAVKKLILIKS